MRLDTWASQNRASLKRNLTGRRHTSLPSLQVHMTGLPRRPRQCRGAAHHGAARRDHNSRHAAEVLALSRLVQARPIQGAYGPAPPIMPEVEDEKQSQDEQPLGPLGVLGVGAAPETRQDANLHNFYAKAG